MKRNDFLLAILVVGILGLAVWAFSTGKFNAVASTVIDGIWNSIQGLIGPILRR